MQHPIGEHALLADSRTAALIDPDGDVAWLCWPRVDSTPLLFSILDDDRGGGISVRPAQHGARVIARSYHSRSLVLETVWAVDGARLIVDDALDLGAHPLLLRRLRAEGGDVDVAADIRAPAWGGRRASLRAVGDVLEVAGTSRVNVRAPGAWRAGIANATCEFRLQAGDATTVTLGAPLSDSQGAGIEFDACSVARDGAATGRCRPRGCRFEDRRIGAPRSPRHQRGGAPGIAQPGRRDRCRAHHVAAAVAGVVTNVGLPVLLAARCVGRRRRHARTRAHRRGAQNSAPSSAAWSQNAEPQRWCGSTGRLPPRR